MRPSFLSSVTRGITGYIKGGLAGGAVGGLAGLAIGAAVGLFTVAGGGLPALGIAAVTGAMYGASFFGFVGALSGMATEVMKSREGTTPPAADTAKAVQMAFNQGVALGLSQSQDTEESKWRDKVTKEKAAQAVNPTQIVH